MTASGPEAALQPDDAGAAGGEQRKMGRWALGAVAAVGCVALAAAGFAVQSWRSATPEISNSCSGVVPVAPSIPRPDGVQEERRNEPSPRTFYRIPYAEDGQFGVSLCLQTDDTVRIDDIRLPELVLFRPGTPPILDETEWSAKPAGTVVKPNATPFVPVELLPGESGRFILVAAMDTCEQLRASRFFDNPFPGKVASAGSSISAVEVVYEYRGRKRSTQIDLLDIYTVDFAPDEACPPADS